MSVALSNDLETVKTTVENTTKRKRFWARIALVILACGMLAAGSVLVSRYRATTANQRTAASLWLTPAGEQVVAMVCGSVTSPLVGTVNDPSQLVAGPVEITLAAGSCGRSAVTLDLQRKQIEIASRR